MKRMEVIISNGSVDHSIEGYCEQISKAIDSAVEGSLGGEAEQPVGDAKVSVG